MSTAVLTYAVVTPVRNDVDNLRRLAIALIEQSTEPSLWIIVDNGSTDDTEAVARELAKRYSWIRVLVTRTDVQVMRGGPIVRAFHAAVEAIDAAPDVIVKLDADITMEPGYFERLLEEFRRDPPLGIAGGIGYEKQRDGVWRQRHGTGAGVWGANRAYRWTCLRDILPLEERMGWDTLDLVKAKVHGWKTEVFYDLPFMHHRVEGERDGRRTRTWSIQGRAAHYMGYRFSYIVVRTLYRTIREPAALALLWGYLSAAARREPACSDQAVRSYVRRQQSVRNLPLRIREALRPREALGRRSG